MRKNLVMTITGNDRVGLVEEITKVVLDFGGNVDSSKMARLGGEFAMLMLVSVPATQFENLREGVRGLQDEGYKVVTRETERGASAKFSGWNSFEIQVNGADNEGLIHEITSHLAELGVSIETMDTGMEPAPMSGGMLFTMTAVILAPPHLDLDTLQDELEEVGDQLNIDTEVEPYEHD